MTRVDDASRVSTPPPGLRVIEWHDGASWDAFVDGASDSTVAHRWAWGEVMARSYGHPTTFLAATNGDVLQGVLPLTLVRTRMFGKHLASMPFLDYGGVCTDGDDAVAQALVREAVRRADDAGADLELRHVGDRDVGLPKSLDKVTMLLELELDAEAQWKQLRSERRNRIRKGEKAGLKAEIQGVDALDDFYAVLARNMHDLGSPMHAENFFLATVETLGDRARFLIVRVDGKPIGAALLLSHGDTLSIPYVSSLRAYFDLCPNQVLYWSAMRTAIEEGFRVLDFGRSSPDAGTFEAKRQWKAEAHQLYWHYHPDTAEPGQDLQRLEWATRVWKRLPVSVVDRLGPRVRGGLPN